MLEWYEPEVRALETKNGAKNGAGAGATVFYGGSSVRLWSTLDEDFAGCHVANLGFGGATLEACVYFFDRLIAPRKPGSIVLYAGDNDLGDGRNVPEVIRYFETFQEKARASGIDHVTFISIKPSPARWELVEKIHAVNERIKEHPVNYIDVYSKMLTKEGTPNVSYFREDGLHMSPAGYRVWIDAIAAHRNEIFTNCS